MTSQFSGILVGTQPWRRGIHRTYTDTSCVYAYIHSSSGYRSIPCGLGVCQLQERSGVYGVDRFLRQL